MKQKRLDNNLVALEADEGRFLHMIGTDATTPLRKTTVKADALPQWEELPLDAIPPYTEAEYEARVEALIRERYSVSQEFALINNAMAGATERHRSEYDAYQEYREQCKRSAREQLEREKNGISDE